MPVTKSIGSQKLWKRLYFYSLFFFVALLPFQPKGLPLTLGMMFFGLCWLLSTDYKNKLEVLGRNKMAGLFFIYFLWVVIGAFYTPAPGEAEKDLVMKLPFAVWPLVLGSLFLFSDKDKRMLLRLFILASVLSILTCFIFAFGAFMNTADIQEFFFTNLVDYKVLPPHYLGMYLSFCYGCLLYNGLRKNYFFGRSVDVLMLVILAVGIVFISVRIQYVAFLLLNCWIFFTFIYHRSGAFKAVSGLLLVLLVFGSLTWAFPGSRHRIRDTYNEIVSFKSTVNQKQTNHRKFLWTEGWEVVQENWLLGTGTGAAKGALQVKLQDNDAKFWDGHDVYYLRDRNYNFHNVYLEHWANHGIIGFIILLAIIILPLFAPGPAEGKIFLLICAVSFSTESMLERQAGVLFFSFFYTMFFMLPSGSKHQNGQQHIK